MTKLSLTISLDPATNALSIEFAGRSTVLRSGVSSGEDQIPYVEAALRAVFSGMSQGEQVGEAGAPTNHQMRHLFHTSYNSKCPFCVSAKQPGLSGALLLKFAAEGTGRGITETSQKAEDFGL